jgi:hypothetical protein
VLDAAKGDVSKALSSEILKDRAKAAQDKADAKEALIEDEEAAYSAYLGAEADRRAAVAKPEPQYVIDAKTFDSDRLKRVWCVKYNLIQTMGIQPTHGGSCP